MLKGTLHFQTSLTYYDEKTITTYYNTVFSKYVRLVDSVKYPLKDRTFMRLGPEGRQ